MRTTCRSENGKRDGRKHDDATLDDLDRMLPVPDLREDGDDEQQVCMHWVPYPRFWLEGALKYAMSSIGWKGHHKPLQVGSIYPRF